MRVAVLHNPRPDRVDPGLPDDEYEEYDSPETIHSIVQALTVLGVSPQPVAAGRDLPQRLDGLFDFVFNIAEGEGRRCREAIPAAVCELLHLPYTGSDPLTLALTLDKAAARRIVSPEVPVPRAALDGEDLSPLRFPVIVKPNDEGSSKGIRRHSVCYDLEAALRQSEWLRSSYRCPVLVEEFLPGAEVTVAMAGNGASVRIVGMMEIEAAHPGAAPFVYSLEMKRHFRTCIRYYTPPRLPEAALRSLRHFALLAWRILGCRDVARMDFRLDAAGRPHFLECNPLPGLNPHSSDLVIATRASLSYEQLVGGILRDATSRYGISL